MERDVVRRAATAWAGRIFGVFAAALVAMGGAGEVLAQQSAQCVSLARQIRSLDTEIRRASPAALRRDARRATADANRIESRMARIGCDNQRFLFFGSDPPAECRGLAAEVTALRQRAAARLAAADAGGPVDLAERRSRIAARYEARGCAASTADAPQAAGGGEASGQAGAEAPQALAGAPTPVEPYREGRGAAGAVCVRLCDGYFFPLSGAVSRGEADAMCQAQCPATPARAFFRRGDGMAGATTIDGKSYSAMPTAFAYTKALDYACSCRAPSVSWREALAPAEAMVSARGKPDIVVTDAIGADWDKVLAESLSKREGRGKPKEAAAAPAPRETAAQDTTAQDTTAQDTTAQDTTVEDTTVEDTTVEDTTASADAIGDLIGAAPYDPLADNPMPPPLDAPAETDFPEQAIDPEGAETIGRETIVVIE
jgi:hypothetical protein